MLTLWNHPLSWPLPKWSLCFSTCCWCHFIRVHWGFPLSIHALFISLLLRFTTIKTLIYWQRSLIVGKTWENSSQSSSDKQAGQQWKQVVTTYIKVSCEASTWSGCRNHYKFRWSGVKVRVRSGSNQRRTDAAAVRMFAAHQPFQSLSYENAFALVWIRDDLVNFVFILQSVRSLT